MGRYIFDEERIHPGARDQVAAFHRDIVDQVQTAIGEHDVVIVGMRQNPFPRRARALLDQRGIRYQYLEYGSYLSKWRRRLALKMWTGWPTFPMIFVKGRLIGGMRELTILVDSGDLERMLAAN